MVPEPGSHRSQVPLAIPESPRIVQKDEFSCLPVVPKPKSPRKTENYSQKFEQAPLALYCFANSQISTALKLLYRARYLATIVCGDNHPDIALLDSNISLILHAVGEYELSLRFLEHALALNIKYYGEKSLKVTVSYHLVAWTQSCMGDFRSALNNEKDLGEAHEKTQESSECLRHLTQQAPPSMGSVLDMLNAINGIIFVQINSKEIANLKNEIEKRQKEGGAAGESSVAQANQEEVDRLLTETMAKTAAGIPFEEQDKYEQWRQPVMRPHTNTKSHFSTDLI
ncbi:clustered mitochondria protein homolog [Culex quinquefasciatus]|uniref:clustered mitochondria protein homolog n=1 Tax=Culex quinquefasciatus TaxID=7176 RepID=UPI0018E2BBAC|nr:clustered mitochondria protein homolog [Culex quinquefasciatus]